MNCLWGTNFLVWEVDKKDNAYFVNHWNIQHFATKLFQANRYFSTRIVNALFKSKEKLWQHLCKIDVTIVKANTVNCGQNFLRVFAAKLWILPLNSLDFFKIDLLEVAHGLSGFFLTPSHLRAVNLQPFNRSN